MPLNKSDKAIIVLFVVILIISIIGIALYKPPKTTETEVKEEKAERLYQIDWRVNQGAIQDISDYVGNKQTYEDKITIHQDNLKTITFNLSWVDNKALLGRLGRDTFTLEVTTPDGMVHTESMQTLTKTKTGNILINIPVNSNPPSVSSIKANSTTEAYKILKERLVNDKWKDKEFTVKITVIVGEKILWRLRDKGNSFTLSVNYEYYNPVLTEKTNVNTTGYTTSSSYKEEGVSTIGRMVTTGSLIRY